MENADKLAYDEAKELLIKFKDLRRTYLNDQESLQIVLAKNRTDVRDLDKDIASIEDLINSIEEH